MAGPVTGSTGAGQTGPQTGVHGSYGPASPNPPARPPSTKGTLPGQTGAPPGSTASAGGYQVGPTGPTGTGTPPVQPAPAPTGAGGPTGVGTYPAGSGPRYEVPGSVDSTAAGVGLQDGWTALRQAFVVQLPLIGQQFGYLAHRGIGG